MAQRCGLPASLKGASWSPWNGISVYGIKIEQPEALQKQFAKPLLQIESIRIVPTWREMAKRRLVMQSIEIKKPEFSVPIEILSHFSSKAAPTQQQPIVKNEPAGSPTPKKTSPSSAPKNEEKVKLSKQPENQPKAPPSPPIEADLRTTWVHISDARFELISSFSETPLYEIFSADGWIPIGGNGSKSTLALRGIRSIGSSAEEKLTLPVLFQKRTLNFGPVKTSIANTTCELGASIGFVRHFPFQASFRTPDQEVEPFDISAERSMQIESFGGSGNLRGLLSIPQTWRGQAYFKATKINVHAPSNDLSFDHGNALFSFSTRAISCLDARMIGDDLSLLGNATILGDGRMAAAGRLVSSPENLIMASKDFGKNDSIPTLTPLSTPQRAALDMQLLGRLGKSLFLKTDPEAEPMLLKLFNQD